jgi:hypothetical protein
MCPFYGADVQAIRDSKRCTNMRSNARTNVHTDGKAERRSLMRPHNGADV